MVSKSAQEGQKKSIQFFSSTEATWVSSMETTEKQNSPSGDYFYCMNSGILKYKLPTVQIPLSIKTSIFKQMLLNMINLNADNLICPSC